MKVLNVTRIPCTCEACEYFLSDSILLVIMTSNDDNSALVNNASNICTLGSVSTSTATPNDNDIIGGASVVNSSRITSRRKRNSRIMQMSPQLKKSLISY